MTRDLDPKHIVENGYDRIGEWYAKQAVESTREDRDRDTSLLSPNPPKEGVGLASRGGKKVLLCFWDNGFVAKKRPRKRSTQ